MIFLRSSHRKYVTVRTLAFIIRCLFYNTCTNQALRTGQGKNEKETEIKSKDVLSMSHCQSLRSTDEQRQDQDDLPSTTEVSHES